MRRAILLGALFLSLNCWGIPGAVPSAPPQPQTPMPNGGGGAPTTAPPLDASGAAALPGSAVDTPQQTTADYSFNPLNVKRDPFMPPESARGKSGNDLLRYDLNEMNLVAILTGMGAPQAMIVLPNGRTHIVQVGDVIGRRAGKVYQIKSNELIVKESFKDYQNRLKTDLTSLVLAQ